MSFAKAKIQRFNDIKDCTPSPAKYNVSVQDKLKHGIISHTARFVKKGGTPPSSETGSVHSTPCFQTPTVPKKKKFLGLSSFKTKSIDREELREKIVECTNKDSYIKDLIEQVEDMTEKLGVLQHEKSTLESENQKLRRQDYDNLKQTKERVDELNKNLHEIRQECHDLKNDSFVELTELSLYVDKFPDLCNKMLEDHQIELERRNREVMGEIRRAHLEEIGKFRQETEALNVKLKTMEDQSAGEIDKYRGMLSGSEAKVKLLEENFKEVSLLTEIQMKEKIDEMEAGFKLKLHQQEREAEAILKECQEISEYNIIESELEKNQLKIRLAEAETVLEEFEKLKGESRETAEELNNIKIEKHAYEVSINTCRETIEVLTKRLINSDRDVEQLKEELAKIEERILEYETRCAELTNQLHQSQLANEELEMQFESTVKILQNQVKSTEGCLLEKVEALREELKQLSTDKDLFSEVLQQHHQQQTLIDQAQETIAQAGIFIDKLSARATDLEAQLKEIQVKLEQESEEAGEIRKKYIDKSGKFDELSAQFEGVVLELERVKQKNQELENLIGPFQEQLEAYDVELKSITDAKRSLADEAKDLSIKYAEILGHHNHNQKIKHVNDLKSRSSELFQKNVDLESKNFKLAKTVERLKREVEELRKMGKKAKFEDKENLASPKCGKVASPGPLKEKN